MAYFDDLTDYEYLAGMARPGTRNVGWLAPGHRFPEGPPSAELLEGLWRLCGVSVARTRGIHDCELCEPADWIVVERGGRRLSLGSAELRAFSPSGPVFAAPNLIFHYVEVHHYKPPEEFMRALAEGPLPPTRAYFERLEASGLEWRMTEDFVGEKVTIKLRFDP